MLNRVFAYLIGGVTEWTPSSIGTVLLDLDPRFVTLNGIDPTKVDVALDQSGNGYDATAGVGQEPTFTLAEAGYNNRPSLRFATNTNMLTPAGSANVAANPITMIVVGHGTAATAYALNRDTQLAVGNDAGGFRRHVAAGAGVSSTFAGNTPGIMVATFEGASSRMYFNSKTPQIDAIGAHNVTPGFGWTLGNYQGGFTLPWGGPICRAIIIDGAILQADAEAALDGLGPFYGIAIAP